MLDTIFGLPLHPLIVHATTVVVPTAALAVLLAAVWPRFRRWAGWGPLALSLVSIVLVPLTTQSGESLEHRLPRSGLIQRHAELADGLLPWVIVLAVGAAGLFWGHRRGRSGTSTLPRWLVALTLVIALVGAIGTTVQVVLIGHSGAEAAWSSTG
ncbi:hypothetical protein GCM10009841_30070 [Microlunatus panaciterrae]|uniref:Membrane protein n=1 Tax=Microlunatus panaciterrae TaxID=400768 RepID=A0ABS2RGK6_9ACTN|nr:DUF2231 domain-containing protein [Microlunatus panaciterrae]MBM7797667.1 putative membrane protein [Microlunatus panaciterrae]